MPSLVRFPVKYFIGRVFGVVGAVGDISLPLAMLVYGVLLSKMDVIDLLLISGGMLMILSLSFFLIYQKINQAHNISEGERLIVP